MAVYCFRKSKKVDPRELCRVCLVRRKCRAYQLWLEPELPFIFKPDSCISSVFDLQNTISDTLHALFASEYRLLNLRALKTLPGVTNPECALVRLKMYEILMGRCQVNKGEKRS